MLKAYVDVSLITCTFEKHAANLILVEHVLRFLLDNINNQDCKALL